MSFYGFAYVLFMPTKGIFILLMSSGMESFSTYVYPRCLFICDTLCRDFILCVFKINSVSKCLTDTKLEYHYLI
jgi:hypothetical protein